MSDDMIDSINWLTDFESVSESAILLDAEDLDRALQLSQRTGDESKHWQSYLSALSLIGFEHWITQRTSDISLNQSRCVMLEPSSGETPGIICNLEANGFKLCLIEVGNFIEDSIAIPKSLIDSLDLNAHFYVSINVDEENSNAFIRGFLRADQIQSNTLHLDGNGFYQLPIEWFNPNSDQLLLLLDCLEPDAIPLTATSPKTVTSSPQPTQILMKPVVKIGQWFQRQLDDLAQETGWMILPPTAFAGALRSTQTNSSSAIATDINGILTSLRRNGMKIPSSNQLAGYREIEYQNLPLRLYLLPATDVTQHEPTEFSLIFVLKLQDSSNLPTGLRLQVSDNTIVIADQVVEPTTQADFLFCRIFGTLNERFLITLRWNDAPAIILEPFEF